MTVVTYIVYIRILEPFSLLMCNCMALLIVAIMYIYIYISACVKLITVVYEYTSPSSGCLWYLAYLELATC